MSGRRSARSGRGASGAPPAEHTPAGQDMTIVLTQPSAGGPAVLGPTAADAPHIHPTAIIEPGVTIGPQTVIAEGVHVRGPSVIGRECVIGEKTHIADGVTIADGVRINTHVHMCSGVTIESSVMIAAGVVFTNERYPRAADYQGEGAAPSPMPEVLKTVVRIGTTIGAGALIGPGVDIGPWAMVGMGAVVTRDVQRIGKRAHKRRFSVKPGLTCLWQVNGREPEFESWVKKDMEYIDNWSLGLDVKILLKTIPVVLSGRGAY